MKESKECRIVSSASASHHARTDIRARHGGFTVFAGLTLAPIIDVFILHVIHFLLRYQINYQIKYVQL